MKQAQWHEIIGSNLMYRLMQKQKKDTRNVTTAHKLYPN